MQIIYLIATMLLLTGCAIKLQDNVQLDECTKTAAVMPVERSGFQGVLFENIDTTKAIPACKKSVDMDPNDTQAKFLLARALTKDESYDEAFDLLLDSLCQKGNAQECTLLGGYYFYGFPPIKQDWRKAVRLYEQACTDGYPPACLNLGKSLIAGKGSVQDVEEGSNLLFETCQGGFADACKHFANSMYFQHIPFDQGRFDYASLKSCENGVDCTDFWRKFRDATDEKDQYENFRVTKSACDNGLAEACEELGNYYFQGIGTPKNNEQAQTYFEQACHNGRVRFGCWYAGGVMLQNQQEKERALSSIDQACYEGDNHFACHDLAMLHLDSPEPSTQEKRTAQRHLTYACNKGHIQSCGVLEILNDDPDLKP